MITVRAREYDYYENPFDRLAQTPARAREHAAPLDVEEFTPIFGSDPEPPLSDTHSRNGALVPWVDITDGVKPDWSSYYRSQYSFDQAALTFVFRFVIFPAKLILQMNFIFAAFIAWVAYLVPAFVRMRYQPLLDDLSEQEACALYLESDTLRSVDPTKSDSAQYTLVRGHVTAVLGGKLSPVEM